MANVQEIADQVMRFLADEMPLEALEDWSAEYSWNLHQRAGEVVQDLAYQIRGILNAHADDETDSIIRQELASAVSPFLESATQMGEPSSSFLTQSNVETHNTAIASAG